MEAEFDAIDEDNKGQIFFEDLVKWALKKNMEIELAKQEEKEKIMAEENGDKKEE
jgi:Ca2+-binding EF-hand superfamily protein